MTDAVAQNCKNQNNFSNFLPLPRHPGIRSNKLPNWVVISSDKNIKKNPFEREALIRAGIATFFFTSGEITNQQKIEFFTASLKQIAKIVINQPRPFVARINRDGTAKIWINHKIEDCLTKKQKRN